MSNFTPAWFKKGFFNESLFCDDFLSTHHFMAMRDKIEHAIQNQPCTVKDLKNKFGGDRGADRKVMEAVDQLVHEAVICQRQGVFFTVRSGRADKALLCKVVKLGKNFAFVMLEDGTSDILLFWKRKILWWAPCTAWRAA